jgi:hypothetical protein
MKPRNGWGTGCLRLVERAGLGSVVSHPFRDEAAKWMGHPGLWLVERAGLGFVVSHPFRDEAAKWMGAHFTAGT